MKEYILFEYQEMGILEGNENVRLVRNSITGKIAVKKLMKAEQKPVYDFLKRHRSDYIPEIYECFEYGRQMIVIEEYIEGRNLNDILSERSFSKEEGCHIVREICRALYPLHMADPPIVCRDLKPENIMLDSCGKVKLIDFDIARRVSPGKNRDTVIMGTEGFAAPEQFGYGQTDGRSDIYSLGAVLNYIILGKHPVYEILEGRLGDVVRRCLLINPDERYQNVKELEYVLEEISPSERAEVPASEQKKEAEAGKEKSWRRFLPPGFRSGTVWKMILAVTVYLAVIDLSFSMEIENQGVVLTGMRARVQQSLFFVSQLLEIGFVFNYMGMRETIPVPNPKNRFLRVLSYIALEFVLIVIAVLVWMLVDGIFFLMYAAGIPKKWNKVGK